MDEPYPEQSLPDIYNQPTPVRAQEQILFSIGDIGLSEHWVVTPNGHAPLAGSAWIARDMTREDVRTPPYAIILAIVFFLACLLGLLFLMVKERRVTGYVEVSVQSGGLLHVTQVPISSNEQVAQVRQMVAQAQSMAARASNA